MKSANNKATKHRFKTRVREIRQQLNKTADDSCFIQIESHQQPKNHGTKDIHIKEIILRLLLSKTYTNLKGCL